MKNTFIALTLFFIIASCQSKKDQKETSEKDVPNAKDSSIVKLVTQAYTFGYPMMTMNYTHKIAGNVETDDGKGHGPINQWGNMCKFPKAGFTEVVRPNVDTYYSVIYADLEKGPLYLHIPATERYYLIPILNAHGDVIRSLGSRTTGQGALDIAFVGPEYNEEIDSNLFVIRSTTNLNWVLGRVAVKNNEDGEAEVSNFQSKLIACPLSERNNPSYTSPKGVVNQAYKNLTPMDVVDNLDIETYLNEVMHLLIHNPAYPGDQLLLDELKTIGFEPGGNFDLNKFNPAAQALIKKVPANVQALFAKMTQNPPKRNLQNGWNVITAGLGEYGTEYFLRAYISKIGYGANQPQDAIYPNCAVDADGNNLNGSNKYILHFDADHLPPVNGFWSLTMYNKKGFLVENTIDRYNLGGMKDLTYNEDGSLDLFIQADAPEKLSSNWLPGPQASEEFELTFRMYYPKKSVLERTYTMPSVQKVNETL